MDEPILTDDDRRLWASWERAARAHALTRSFARRVDSARSVIDEASRIAPASIGWSAGKDSTVLVHLACVEMGLRDALEVHSVKDDLDFPGEREYVERLGAQWGLRLTVVEPPGSLVEWVRRNASSIRAADDMHSRSSALSAEFFYPVIEAATRRCACVLLGLRAEESRGRNASRASHGLIYRVSSGQWRATPLGDWSGMDVLAYAVSRGVELLPVYRCVSLMHRDEPWRIRKSWWLPGASAARGQAAWLRRYYPSLYARASEWIPSLRGVT